MTAIRQLARSTLVAGSLLALGVSSALAGGQPFELTVKNRHTFGSSHGTLVFDADGIEYRTAKPSDQRRWNYPDLKQVQVLTPTRLALLTYEDQGRLRLGADRTYRFDLTQGTFPPEMVAFLLDRIPHPLVSAVMPDGDSQPALYRAPVKYERRRQGSDGTLVLREDALAYVTDTVGHARYWRMSDIFAVLRLDRFRLEVVAYEGGGGKTRRFAFQLKTDVPQGFYDALWARVNAPSPPFGGAAPAPPPGSEP